MIPPSSHFPTKQNKTNFQYRILALYNESMGGWMAGRLHGVWRGFPFPLIFKCMEDGEFHWTGRTWYNAVHLTGGGGTINEWLWRELEGGETEIKRVYIE